MGRGCAAGRRAPHSSDDAEEFHHPAGPKGLKLYALYMKRKVARDRSEWLSCLVLLYATIGDITSDDTLWPRDNL